MSLRIPDASVTDIVGDLVMLKEQTGFEDASRSHDSRSACEDPEDAESLEFEPYREREGLRLNCYQRFTIMDEYSDQSFEVSHKHGKFRREGITVY